MALYGFGAGALWGTPLTDAFGAAIANPTPILFGVLQDVSVDISADVKELYGQNSFPEAVARGKTKISCKAKYGRVNGLFLNSLFFGQTMSSGNLADVYDTTGSTIPAVSPYFLNPTPPNSGTWAVDLGVRNANGNPMTRVASAPATGQYTIQGPVTGATASFATNVMTVTIAGVGSFAVGQVIVSAGVAAGTYITSLGTGTGGVGTYNLSTSPGTIAAQAVAATEVYTFAAADAGLAVYISYQYTSATPTTAQKSTVMNIQMGNAPSFRCDLMSPYSGEQTTLTLFKCVSTKLTIATKLDDFLIPEFDFSAFANGAGQVLQWGTTE